MLLLSKEALQQRVLADQHLSIYPCGRTDIATGQIDRRVLAMLEYLVSKGFQLTITALKCGHSYLTTSGNVSEHAPATRSTSPTSTACRSPATRARGRWSTR